MNNLINHYFQINQIDKMPKRPFPFEESFVTQSKIKITDKDIDNGVLRKDKMKSVYGK